MALANTQHRFCRATIQALQQLLTFLLHLRFTVVANQMIEAWPTKTLSLRRKMFGVHFWIASSVTRLICRLASAFDHTFK